MEGVYHYWGNDIGISSAGGLQKATGSARSHQRVLRRLMTAPGTYIFHPEYGGGLGSWVGGKIQIPKLKATIMEQLYLEESVSRTPVPVIEMTQNFRTLHVRITYVESDTNTQTALSFSLDE